jgi:hypothetical protein
LRTDDLCMAASRQCNRMHQRSDLLLSFTSTQACFDANPPRQGKQCRRRPKLQVASAVCILNHSMLCFFSHCQHWQILPSPTCLLRQMNIPYGLELSQRQRQRQQCQVFRHQVRRSEKPQCLLWTQRMYGGLQTVANLRFCLGSMRTTLSSAATNMSPPVHTLRAHSFSVSQSLSPSSTSD